MFLSTVEKQLDAKRRIVLPAEFRAAASGPFDGVFCFPSMEADCIEAGGQTLFDTYVAIIEEMPFGSEMRTAMENRIFGRMVKLAYDTAGRITLPDSLCKAFDLTDEVIVVGLKDRFQIWSAEAYRPYLQRQDDILKEGYTLMRSQRQIAAQA